MSLEDELLRQRQERIEQIRMLGFEPYGHAFAFTHTIPQILGEYGNRPAEELGSRVQVRVAGRILTIRRMGKAGFLHLQQGGEKLALSDGVTCGKIQTARAVNDGINTFRLSVGCIL